MSNAVFNRVCYAQLKPSEKTVLLILASIANDDGSTQKFAPIGRIMAYSCMSRRTVTYSLRALEDAGIIATTAKHGEIPTYFINPNFAPAPSKGCEDLIENPFEIAESAPRANAAPVQIMQNNEQYLHEGGASVAWGGANIDNKTAIFAPYTSTSFTSLTPSTSAQDAHAPEIVKTDKPEKQTELKFNAKKSLLDLGCSAQIVDDFLTVRKAKRAPLTKTALDRLTAQATKAGISAAEAVEICAIKNWQSFDASWEWQGVIKIAPKQQPQQPREPVRSYMETQTPVEERIAFANALKAKLAGGE